MCAKAARDERISDAYPSPNRPATYVRLLTKCADSADQRRCSVSVVFPRRPIFTISCGKAVPRARRGNLHAQKRTPGSIHPAMRPGRCNRSSNLATVLPCQRPPRAVATFCLVSSSAIFRGRAEYLVDAVRCRAGPVGTDNHVAAGNVACSATAHINEIVGVGVSSSANSNASGQLLAPRSPSARPQVQPRE